jgi:hypothetical protein
MARDYDAYMRATQAAQTNSSSKKDSEIQGLPPGYLQGGRLSITETGQVNVEPIVANVGGVRVHIPADYAISETDFICNRLSSMWYYLYLAEDATYKADVIPFEFDSAYMGHYHPVNSKYRAIGKFYIDETGAVTRVTNIGRVQVEDIDTDDISTLFLRATSAAIVGFTGDDNTNPEEGARRTYIDGDEIGLEVYTHGAWATERSIKLGGVDSNGNFLPFLSCRGLLGDMADAPETTGDPLPDDTFYHFDFENDMTDQNGADPWTILSGTVAYDSAIYWEGSYSLKDGVAGGLPLNPIWSNIWTTGNDLAVSARVYSVFDSGSANSMILFHWAAGMADQILVTLEENGSQVSLTVRKAGTPTTQTFPVSLANGWHHWAVMWDDSADTLTVLIDTDELSMTVAGAWTGGSGGFGIHAQDDTYKQYIDDFIISFSSASSAEVFLQHYQRGLPWFSAFTYKDLFIKPRPGGKIRLLGDVGITCGLAVPTLHVQDQKAAGTHGGGLTSGAWRTRTLNTVVLNTITGASLAADQITLPAGTYEPEISTPGYAVARHQAGLYNVTAAAWVTRVDGNDLIGSPIYAHASYGVNNRSEIRGRFVLAAPATLEVRHRVEITNDTNGGGVQGNFGVIEIYTDVIIRKVG